MGQHYLWRMQTRFKRIAMEADAIAIVGARPWPEDKHVWDAITTSRANVLYVGGNDDFYALRLLRGSNPTLHVGERFENCLDELTIAL